MYEHRLNCDRHYGFADAVCSGNGICVENRCVCHNGWTSMADMQLIHEYDCDINILTIKSLAIIATILSILCLCYLLYNLFHLRKHPRDAKISCIYSFIVSNIGILLYSIPKSIDPV